jgi:exopolysaccharide biosynthesis polyprenyl glycosylphosphotransferase
VDAADAYSMGLPSEGPLRHGQSARSRNSATITSPSVPTQGRLMTPDLVTSVVVDAIDAPLKAPRRRGRVMEIAALGLVDTFVLALAALLGGWLVRSFTTRDFGAPQVVLTVAASLLGLIVHGGYRSDRGHVSPVGVRSWRAALYGYPTAVVVLALFSGSDLGVEAAALATLPGVVMIPLGRRLARLLPMPGRAQTSRILIVGSGKVARRVASRLGRVDGIQVVGMVDSDPPPGEKVLGGLSDLVKLVDEHRVDQVLVAFSRTPGHDTLEILRKLNHQVSVSVVPRMFEMLSWRSSLEEIDGIPLLHVAPASLSTSARVMKRALDIVVAGLSLIILSPVVVVSAIAVRLDSAGPIFFRQQRWGRRGEPFQIIKFRTMENGAENARKDLASDSVGPLFKLRADPRITRVGAWLRRTSLDEIPQLFNVLCGQMSLVGPRPFVPDEAAQIVGSAARRYDVPPGMTGLWQISGRSDLNYDDLRHLDTVYVASWSLWWDLRILFQTPGAVIRRKGAF